MPEPTYLQNVTWPGVLGVASCTGTVSHGTTPGQFLLTTYPQVAAPAGFGDLVFSDGPHRVPLKDCRVAELTATADGGGQVFVLHIEDRRWKWRTGAVSGRYNQYDRNGKLVPWSIRSPEELARLCLEAMGEKNYLIRLPKGLTKADGADTNRYLLLGENFPQTLTNPPVVWDYTVPAEALARVAEYYGCRVIYQPQADRVYVGPVGEGGSLPEAPSEVIAPSLKAPATPAAVGVAGAPVRFQMRFVLEPVGRDWDGRIVPINSLSYAPLSTGGGGPQQTTVTFTGATPAEAVRITITWTDEGGFEHTVTLSSTDPTMDIAARWADLIAQLAASEAAGVVTMSAVAGVLTVTGTEPTLEFDVEVQQESGSGDVYAVGELQAAGQPVGRSWSHCPPPTFTRVRPDPDGRLSYEEARGLACESVWKMYRIRFEDVTTGGDGITVPGYGKLKRRQQVVLTDRKVEQVKPQPRIQGGVNAGNNVPGLGNLPGQGIMPEFYNGYSRDQAATVTGSIRASLGSVIWDGARVRGDLNTAAANRVFVGFTVDPVEQVITFSDFVYKWLPVVGSMNQCFAPRLILETAVVIQDADTSEPVRWGKQLALGGAAPVEWAVREDVQADVVVSYADNGERPRVTGWRYDKLGDANPRADYYLAGMAKKYQLSGGGTRQYPMIQPVELDGRLQQVTWSVGGEGPTTTASENTEHSPVIPSYPARRLAENLPPDRAAAAANKIERAAVDAMFPAGPGGGVAR